MSGISADSPTFEPGTLCLEFLYSDLNIDRDKSSDDVAESIHAQITSTTPQLEDEITAVQFWPDKRFPKKVFIFLNTQRAKDTLKTRGIDLFGGHAHFY